MYTMVIHVKLKEVMLHLHVQYIAQSCIYRQCYCTSGVFKSLCVWGLPGPVQSERCRKEDPNEDQLLLLINTLFHVNSGYISKETKLACMRDTNRPLSL